MEFPSEVNEYASLKFISTEKCFTIRCLWQKICLQKVPTLISLFSKHCPLIKGHEITCGVVLTMSCMTSN